MPATDRIIFCLLFIANALYSAQDIRKVIAKDLKLNNDKHLCQILPQNIPSALSFNALPSIARKQRAYLFLKEIETAKKSQIRQNSFGITKAELLSCLHYINTIADYRGTYFPKEQTNLSHTIEYDPNSDRYFIVLEGEGVYIGKGMKKVVSKALSYDGKRVQVVARAEQTIEMDRELAITKTFGGRTGLFKTVGFGQHEEDGIPHYTIYSELYVPGSLQNVFKKKHKLTLHEKITIAYDIAKGLRTLHHYGIVHRDLGVKNYLVNIEKGKPGRRYVTACIADFGRAKDVAEVDALDKRLQGNTTYMAPEGHHFSETNPIDHYKMDVFAFGCVLYRLFYGIKAPWQDRSYVNDTRPLFIRHSEHADRVMEATEERRVYLAKKYRLSRKERFEYLILQMLDVDPDARPSAKKLYNKLTELYY